MPSNDDKPRAWFFADPGSLTQTIGQGFGPVDGNLENEFRITSKFSCSASSKAYSICKGIVLVQPQTGSSTKVNVVIRPFNQPFPGLKIKCFIYRGLEKSDFFTADTEPLVIPPTNATSDLINKINNDFDDFYSETLYDPNGNVIPKPSLTAKFIGYDPAVTGAALLSDLFFKESQISSGGETGAFELPLIDGGKLLGNFEAGEGAIDVVLDYGEYRHEFDNGDFIFDLNYVRSIDAKITLAGTDMNKKLQKEQSTQFIDIAAFYGLFVNNGIIKVSTNGTVSEKTSQAIYNDLLAPFVTKNNWYIYIQGDRTRSYDFYKFYAINEGSANNLKIGLAENTVADARYEDNGWPLLINKQQRVPATEKNELFLQLVTDNNTDSVLYVPIGDIGNAQQDNFCNSDNLKMPPDDMGNYSNLTRVLKFKITAAPDGTNIAGMTTILYKGVSYDCFEGELENANNQMVDIFSKPNFFDDIFDLIRSASLFRSSNNRLVGKMTSSKLQLINHYYDQKQHGISAVQTITVSDMIQTGDPVDPELLRVSYLTETADMMTEAGSSTGALPADAKTSSAASIPINPGSSYDLLAPYSYSTILFTDNEISINGVVLKAPDEATPGKIVLGLAKQENDLIKDLVITGRKNPRLFLVDLFKDGYELLSPEKIKYRKYKVGLVAEVGELLQLFLPATDILVYSLDKKFHFSELYSRYMPAGQPEFDNQVINIEE